jgi:hypothetical protein
VLKKGSGPDQHCKVEDGGASWEIIQDEEAKILTSAGSAPMPLLWAAQINFASEKRRAMS